MALTDTKVRSAKPEEKEYSLVDGDGMSLLVNLTAQSIGDFVSFGGKQHLMAFGVYPEISLANARQREKRPESWLLLALILVSISVL
jgi:hypothetical protein